MAPTNRERTFTGEVRRDARGVPRFVPDCWTAIGCYLTRHIGKRLSLQFLTAAEVRTIKQNRYLHWVIDRIRESWAAPTRLRNGVVVPNEPRWQVSHKAAHNILLEQFGPQDESTPLGTPRKSETQYTTAECAEVTERLRAYHLSEYEVPIPPPNEWDEEDAA